MAEAAVPLPSEGAAPPAPPAPAARAGGSDDDSDELRRRARDPPITFTDIDGAQEFSALQAALAGAGVALAGEEQQALAELDQYLVHGEGSWALGDDFLAFIGRLLGAESTEDVRVATLRCLAAMALRDDVSLLLHQDRRSHALMNYAQRVDRLPPGEQLALARALCNLFENVSSSEWLLYISEWDLDGQPISNIRVTTKVAVHATLGEDAELRDVGTALMYNMATKERLSAGRALRDLLPRHAKSKWAVGTRPPPCPCVFCRDRCRQVFDDVSVELAMALLQLLGQAPAEEELFRAVAALARLAHHSQEVAQLVALVGPPPAAFRGTSPRCDEKIDLIMQKVK
ncbi:hypothetical protein MSG28_004395 [Choristoneura fumiferana]|uniref:Uncharacterized protein n=1 Tax=Choristoneura fumiferana TaxID=7141 RepID=A0ACC0KIN8_CHOFU|nr:hypothetical protein MSG28_004395 [Choristoneura fumiferana]